MFLIVTIIIAWFYQIVGWQTFDHPFSWGDVGAWRGVLFSPIMLCMYLLWFVGFTFVSFVIVIRSQSRFFAYIPTSRNRTGDLKEHFLKAVDIPLMMASIILALYGGVERQLDPLILGITLTFGLLLYLAEQWLRTRLI
jgi:hypothetical protein